MYQPPSTQFGTLICRGICENLFSGIWVRRTLNPVSGKKSIFSMATRLVFMLRRETLRLDERQQAGRRGFEAWILKHLEEFLK
ncbi:hypothetical protein TNCV_4903731 [Trichonephila clavipes]|uniref:Uncharacterized protein n=1 Tax=Trichonephila clavipes TaxID=2585209 RepID=A0A8X6SET2_TRICX|nr:hypothetical protein TNCV_4903731 [Trichonephila clavipes]